MMYLPTFAILFTDLRPLGGIGVPSLDNTIQVI